VQPKPDKRLIQRKTVIKGITQTRKYKIFKYPGSLLVDTNAAAAVIKGSIFVVVKLASL
jgi:hypothetical protein